MAKKKKYICEVCGRKHDGTYGSGRFCSNSCKQKYVHNAASESVKEKWNETLKRNCDNQKESNNKLRDKLLSSNHEEMPLSTARFGKYGELKVAEKFVRRSIPVYLSITEAEEADMVADFGGKLQKIQVKSSSTVDKSGSFRFALYNPSNRIKNGKAIHEKEAYSKESVDYFALYSSIVDRVFLVKNTGNMQNFHIRNEFSQYLPNSHFADDYDIDRVLDIIQSGIDPEAIIDGDWKFTTDDLNQSDDEELIPLPPGDDED